MFRDETRNTWLAYEKNAIEYAASTREFDAFPGLRAEVSEFERRSLPGWRLLDLGCGAGRDSAYLASLGREVVAADLSAALLDQAKLHAAGRKEISAVRCEMLDMPFRTEAFGGVWACGSLLHLPATCWHARSLRFTGFLRQVASLLPA